MFNRLTGCFGQHSTQSPRGGTQDLRWIGFFQQCACSAGGGEAGGPTDYSSWTSKVNRFNHISFVRSTQVGQQPRQLRLYDSWWNNDRGAWRKADLTHEVGAKPTGLVLAYGSTLVYNDSNGGLSTITYARNRYGQPVSLRLPATMVFAVVPPRHDVRNLGQPPTPEHIFAIDVDGQIWHCHRLGNGQFERYSLHQRDPALPRVSFRRGLAAWRIGDGEIVVVAGANSDQWSFLLKDDEIHVTDLTRCNFAEYQILQMHHAQQSGGFDGSPYFSAIVRSQQSYELVLRHALKPEWIFPLGIYAGTPELETYLPS